MKKKQRVTRYALFTDLEDEQDKQTIEKNNTSICFALPSNKDLFRPQRPLVAKVGNARFSCVIERHKYNNFVILHFNFVNNES